MEELDDLLDCLRRAPTGRRARLLLRCRPRLGPRQPFWHGRG
ncbi:hypothetical protein ACTMU2_11705 [Cupriavidus basilensis]